MDNELTIQQVTERTGLSVYTLRWKIQNYKKLAEQHHKTVQLTTHLQPIA